MGRIYSDPMGYATCDMFYSGGRKDNNGRVPIRRGWDSFRPADNTTLHTDRGGYTLRFYATDLLSVFPGGYGRIHVGHGTVTTLSRIRRFAPRGLSILSHKGDWFLGVWTAGKEWTRLLAIPSGGCFLPTPDMTGYLTADVLALMAAGSPLPILADRLEDAGYSDQHTLASMRTHPAADR